ncbi:hypothetical protein [Sessilibacter corallicola]|uniref:Uncharacterized protein n=1 Tax=Sessilibacter corallicola TaxID=2904075 RepID=A0ABQ0A503_9GAMM
MVNINKEQKAGHINTIGWLAALLKVTTLFAGIPAYVLYFGHTFLYGFLTGYGFESPSFSASTYDLVLYFMIGTRKVFDAFLGPKIVFGLVGIFFAISILFIFILLSLLLLRKFSPTRFTKLSSLILDNKKEAQASGEVKLLYVTLNFFERIHTWVSRGVGIYFVLAIVFYIAWRLGISGLASGIDLAKEQINGFQCYESSDQITESGVKSGCTMVTTKSGEVLTGRRIYQSTDRVFFYTKNGSYELTNDLEIRFFSPALESTDNH